MSQTNYWRYTSLKLTDSMPVIAIATASDTSGKSFETNVYFSYVAKDIVEQILIRLRLWENAYIKLLLDAPTKEELYFYTVNNSDKFKLAMKLQTSFLDLDLIPDCSNYPHINARNTLIQIQKEIFEYEEIIRKLSNN